MVTSKKQILLNAYSSFDLIQTTTYQRQTQVFIISCFKNMDYNTKSMRESQQSPTGAPVEFTIPVHFRKKNFLPKFSKYFFLCIPTTTRRLSPILSKKKNIFFFRKCTRNYNFNGWQETIRIRTQFGAPHLKFQNKRFSLHPNTP